MDSSTQNLHINESLDAELNNVADFGSGSNTDPAVKVRDVWLTFGGQDDAPGVRGANMTVDRGSIYALLGPSGCGKTTLVSTVVGVRTPLKGDVRVLGYKPGSRQSGAPGPWVGFMPQETSLLMELTVEETISFFAILNCVPKSILNFRVDSMIKFLDLPKERFVRQLSGGQQRRLSLALALVHDPPLVILDEPTVGVDPLLRKAIWRHLTEIVNEKGTTVILTTHYVEEARAANKVALMRHGKILIEESPTPLMSRFGASSLEEVFLKLCTNETRTQPLMEIPEEENGGELSQHQNCSSTDVQTTFNSVQSTSRCEPSRTGDHFDIKCYEPDELTNKSCSPKKTAFKPLPNVNRTFKETMSVIFGLCWKDQCLFRRNFMFLILAFVVPISNFFLIRLYFGHLPIGLSVILVGSKTETFAKSLILDHFRRVDLDVSLGDTLEESINSLRLGHTNAVIQIPDEFSINILKRFRLGLKADNSTVEKGQLKVFLDNTNMVIGTTVYVSILQSMQNMVIDMSQTVFGGEPNSARFPLHICEPIFGKPDIELTHAIMLGEVPHSLFVIGLFISLLTFVRNRENRMLHRFKACGLGPFEMMASHVILHSGLVIIQITSMLGVLIALQIEIRGSYAILLMLMTLACFVGMAAGMVISVMAGRIYVAVLLATLLQFATIAMAGIFWPIEATPIAFQWFSYIHPMLFIVRAFRLVIDHGIGLESFHVWLSIPHSLVIITLLASVTGFIYNGNNLEIVESILALRRPNIIIPWEYLRLPKMKKPFSKS